MATTLAKAAELPDLPKPDAAGNYPAVEYARASLARKIIRDRVAVGLTQRALAKLAGISVEHLCRIETGKHVPSIPMIDKIDRALKQAGKRAKRAQKKASDSGKHCFCGIQLFRPSFVSKIMVIPDSLDAAHENLLRVIPKPLTAEEEAERVRTNKAFPKVDPAALHDAARRFVDELSRFSEARVEIRRRGTLCVKLTGANSPYLTAKTNAIKALHDWRPTDPILQKLVGSFQHRGDRELVAGVRHEYERLIRLLNYEDVPEAIRPLLTAWHDAAWSIISKGENDSLDGCYWLLHADKLQDAFNVPAAAPKVRQAADALVGWLKGGGDGASPMEKWRKWALSKPRLAVVVFAVIVFTSFLVWTKDIIESVSTILNFLRGK